MTPEHFLKLKKILGDTLERPPQAQESYLRQVCGEDQLLYREVRALLRGQDVGSMPLANRLNNLENEDLTNAVVGDWRLLEALGCGGMGEVWRASSVSDPSGEPVAVKLLHRERCSPQTISRFERERDILGTLEHPQIVGLLDAGVRDDGRPYLVMPLVKGKNIDHYCRENALMLSAIIELFLQVAEVLAYAHERGIVHRDIKGSNIMVTQEGIPMLMDFGIARLVEEPGVQVSQHLSITRTGELLMTPAYAAPEQLDGQQASPASDVYTLSLLLFQTLSGSSHSGNVVNPKQGARSLLLELEAASQQNILDGPTVAVLRNGLAVEAQGRYRDGSELARALRQLLNQSMQVSSAKSRLPLLVSLLALMGVSLLLWWVLS